LMIKRRKRATAGIRTARQINLINTDKTKDAHYNTEIGANLATSLEKRETDTSRRWYFHSLMTFPLTRDSLIVIFNQDAPMSREAIRHRLRHKGKEDLSFALRYSVTAAIINHSSAYGAYTLNREQFCRYMLESTVYVLSGAYMECLGDVSKVYTRLDADTLRSLPLRFHVDELKAKILNHKIWNIYGERFNLDILLYALRDSGCLDFQSSDAAGAATGVLGRPELSMVKFTQTIEIDEHLVKRTFNLLKGKPLKIKGGW